MSLELKKRLLKTYGSFADKRIKNIEKGNIFVVDGRDHEAMNSAFCMIFAEITAPDQFVLRFQGNLPLNESVKKLIASRGGTVDESPYHTSAEISGLTAADAPFISELASSIRAVTRKPYKVKSWKYSATRVADGLDRFVAALSP